jgi:hypothetical protein
MTPSSQTARSLLSCSGSSQSIYIRLCVCLLHYIQPVQSCSAPRRVAQLETTMHSRGPAAYSIQSTETVCPRTDSFKSGQSSSLPFSFRQSSSKSVLPARFELNVELISFFLPSSPPAVYRGRVVATLPPHSHQRGHSRWNRRRHHRRQAQTYQHSTLPSHLHRSTEPSSHFARNISTSSTPLTMDGAS